MAHMERIQSGNVDASGKPMMVEARGVSKSFLLGSGPSLVPVVREVDFRARTGGIRLNSRAFGLW